MPYRPKKRCAYNGCRNMTDKKYCEEHERLVRSESYKKYDAFVRDSESTKFYNSNAWKEVRKIQLLRHPLCEECFRNNRINKAEMVDHIIPIKKGGAKLDYNNLQSLCNACHNKKTKEESR